VETRKAVAEFGLLEAKILTTEWEGEEIHNGVRILYETVWRFTPLVHRLEQIIQSQP